MPLPGLSDDENDEPDDILSDTQLEDMDSHVYEIADSLGDDLQKRLSPQQDYRDSATSAMLTERDALAIRHKELCKALNGSGSPSTPLDAHVGCLALHSTEKVAQAKPVHSPRGVAGASPSAHSDKVNQSDRGNLCMANGQATGLN